MMSPRRLALCLLPLPLLLTACGLFARSYVAAHYYTLDVEPELPAAAEPAVNALAVARLSSPSHYRDRIFYRGKDHSAGYYEYDRWVQPPAELLTRVLSRALRGARVARAVARDTLLRDADLLLAGELVRFDIAIRGPRDYVAECEIQLILTDTRTRKVLFAERFAATSPVRKPTVPVVRPKAPAMVAAMNQAVGEVVTKATAALAKALADLPKAPPATQ